MNSDIGEGSGKISCTFAMVFQGIIVDLKESKAICSKPKITENVKGLEIMSDSSGNIFTINMRVKKGSTKGSLKKVVIKLATTTTTNTTEQQSKYNQYISKLKLMICFSLKERM